MATTSSLTDTTLTVNGETFVGAVGMVIWWAGTTNTIPSNTKICNGQPLSRTTYATLYNKIGTTYGYTSSSDFKVPDLRIGTATTNGRFIRARFGDTLTIQNDAIRNIYGEFSGLQLMKVDTSEGSEYYNAAEGVYFCGAASLTTSPTVTGPSSNHQLMKVANEDVSWRNYAFKFSANGGSTSYNPMSGHANGDDIHPYNISLIPIIVVS